MLTEQQLERFKELFETKILPATKGREKELFEIGEKARKVIIKKEEELNNKKRNK